MQQSESTKFISEPFFLSHLLPLFGFQPAHYIMSPTKGESFSGSAKPSYTGQLLLGAHLLSTLLKPLVRGDARKRQERPAR